MPVYRKLVRDFIPQIIQSSGKTCRVRVLEEEEYKQELTRKLKEESEEYFAARQANDALEELADMLEVMRSLATLHGASWEQLEALREKKAKMRGGFEKRVFLIDVEGDV